MGLINGYISLVKNIILYMLGILLIKVCITDANIGFIAFDI